MADVPIDSEQDTEMVKDQSIPEDDLSCENFHDGQLSYVGHDIESIPQKLVEDYSKVTTRLDLSFNQVKNLTGLEEFCNLQELVLDNNEVDDTTVFPCLQQLHTLTLNKNKLLDLEHLIAEIKSKFPRLTYLSLLGNAACPNQLSSHDKDDEDYARYRYKVLYNLPKLKFLDSTQVTPVDLEEAKRVGPYLTVVRGTDDPQMFHEESPPSPSQYSPLPNAGRTSDEHQGTFGKSKYVYYGKHSEGNRFIRNTDL